MAKVDKRYTLLFFAQALGSLSLISQCVPIYARLLDDPGTPQRFGVAMVVVAGLSVVLVQTAYWYRVFNVILPVRTKRVVVGHLILFASRLGFIVASALFSIVLFRHLPEIDFAQNWSTFLWRGLLLLAVLFTLFCFTTELERLGSAMRGPERQPLPRN
ncbi:hypothetical protein [Rhizobium tubonense]|uniref:Uncharacterized protein n=1 Tax=Rhizobium tubonense TaxID=484088 RepID=A0A2W4CTP2_9HYPH|nr:hypothetical protein [Rhizobium tubonense]PZM15759.1 hypothetical protein CPY51_06250 [Rhizobium tubonense]